MILANEGTWRDLELMQWRWCSSSLLVCDYLKLCIASHAGSCNGLFFYVSKTVTLVMLHRAKEAISFVTLLLCVCSVCVCVCVYEKEEMINISTIYHNTSFMRMYLA